MLVQGLRQGDRARYPFKLRGRRALNRSNRCRINKAKKTAVNQHDCGFLMPSQSVTDV